MPDAAAHDRQLQGILDRARHARWASESGHTVQPSDVIDVWRDEDADPLEGADVGETRTVRRSKTLHGIDMEPREFFGTDRLFEVRIADVEVIEGDQGDADDIEVTWEAELTKRLPRNWDYHREPITAEEKRQARRYRWTKRIVEGMAWSFPFVVASLIAAMAFSGLSGMTINGEPVSAPSFWEVAGLMLLIYVIAGAAMVLVHGRPREVSAR